MRLTTAPRVQGDFPDLQVVPVTLEGMAVMERRPDLDALKAGLEARLREQHAADALKDEPRVRAYRDFFWRLGIDPTKVRPASEALVRKVVRGRPLPTINTAVDALNVASIETNVAFAAFDMALLHGDLTLRYASPGERFLGIGMEAPIALEGNELVIHDTSALVAVYPYRDADATKLTDRTTGCMLLGCGVPGVGGSDLRKATERCAELMIEYTLPRQ
jgi:DNA/RNA-binding domain of Phe-tRNA-synthetase-like protein